MKNTALCMILFLSLILIGCSQQQTLAEDYEPVGNEKELFDVPFFQSKEVIVQKLGEPAEKEAESYIYPNKGLEFSFTDKDMKHVKVTNPDYRIGESIRIGEDIDKVIEKEIRLTFYLYDTQPDQDGSTIYFNKDMYKVVMNVESGRISEITIFPEETSFSKYVVNKESELSDRKLKLQSEYLNFKPNVDRNNKRILLGKFEEFVAIGIVEGVPVPLGMKEKELVRRYEDGEFIFKNIPGGSSEHYLFYRQFGVYFGIKNKTVNEIVIPVTLKEDKLLASYSFTNKKLMVGKDKEVSYVAENGIVTNIVMSEIH